MDLEQKLVMVPARLFLQRRARRHVLHVLQVYIHTSSCDFRRAKSPELKLLCLLPVTEACKLWSPAGIRAALNLTVLVRSSDRYAAVKVLVAYSRRKHCSLAIFIQVRSEPMSQLPGLLLMTDSVTD